MSIINKVSEALSASGPSLKSIVKLALLTRRASITRAADDTSRPLIILGNGPSLSQTLERHAGQLRNATTMAVNFAASTDIFSQIRPRYYILADPHFFSGAEKDPNLSKLYAALAAVDWRMTLIVPVKFERCLPEAVKNNANISVATINAVGIEGWRWLTRAAYSSARGMPRPRNVLIAAIMAGVQMGYREIYIAGADHSWMQTISVNENNEVVSVQPHFYKDSEKELKRINTAYLHYPLHTIIHSFYVAFKAYHDIRAYADSRGIIIYNSTPGSFIDAFERRELRLD